MLIISSRIAIDPMTKSLFVGTQEILVGARKKLSSIFYRHNWQLNCFSQLM
jgi:hypothetical protein